MSNEDICGSTETQSGEPCRNTPIGNGRCHIPKHQPESGVLGSSDQRKRDRLLGLVKRIYGKEVKIVFLLAIITGFHIGTLTAHGLVTIDAHVLWNGGVGGGGLALFLRDRIVNGEDRSDKETALLVASFLIGFGVAYIDINAAHEATMAAAPMVT